MKQFLDWINWGGRPMLIWAAASQGLDPGLNEKEQLSTSICLSLLPGCGCNVTATSNSCCHAFPAMMDCEPKSSPHPYLSHFPQRTQGSREAGDWHRAKEKQEDEHKVREWWQAFSRPGLHPSANSSCTQRTSQSKQEPASGSNVVPQNFSWRLGRWLSGCPIFIPHAIIKDLEKSSLGHRKGLFQLTTPG